MAFVAAQTHLTTVRKSMVTLSNPWQTAEVGVSQKGIKTPKAVIDLIEERLAYASEVYEERCQENPEERN
jgi:hypothetical protein